jgi:hypothetical protein
MIGGSGHRWGEGLVAFTDKMKEKYSTQENYWNVLYPRLKSWNFTSQFDWDTEPVATPLPSIRLMQLSGPFYNWKTNGISKYKLIDGVDWHDIPNVFHPDWESFVDNHIKQMTAPFANSPWVIGYQVANEYDWNTADGAALSAWKRPVLDEAKKAWIDVAKCHGDIAYFNRAWNTQFADFDAAANTTVIPVKSPTPAAEAMCWDFQNLVLEKYLKPCKTAINKYTPGHLLLGVRQHVHNVDEYFNTGFWETMGKYCDVISINYYTTFVNPNNGVPTAIENHLRGIHELTKRPVMTSEWHPLGNIADDEEYKKYNYYQKYMASRDYMVGTQFFQYDGEEKRKYGVVDMDNVPYPDLERAFKETNPQIQNIHATGKITDFTYEKLKGLTWKEAIPTTTSTLTGTNFTCGDLTLEVKNWGINIKKTGVDFGTFSPVLKLTVNDAVIYPGFSKQVIINKIIENTNYTVVKLTWGVATTNYNLDANWELWIPKATTLNNGNWFAVRMTGAQNPSQTTYNYDKVFYSIYTYDKTAVPMDVYSLDINGWKLPTNSISLFDAANQLGEGSGQEAQIFTNGGQYTSMFWDLDKSMVGAQGFSEAGPMGIVMITPSTTNYAGYETLKTAYENACFNVDPNFKEKMAWEIDPAAQALLKKCSQEPYRIAFNGPHFLPGKIQVEDFDEGKEGVTYNDTDDANNGGQYRATAVDIKTSTDVGGGHQLGWVSTGEWLEYTVNLATAGTYDLKLRYATINNAATIKVSFNGRELATLNPTSTGSWATMGTFIVPSITIPETTNGILRLEITGGQGIDLNWIALESRQSLDKEDFEAINNSISIYPNPTNTSFKVTGLSNSYSYELYNMQGQLVGKNENQNAESTINTNTLPEGIYGIRIKSGQNVYNKKVVVSEK